MADSILLLPILCLDFGLINLYFNIFEWNNQILKKKNNFQIWSMMWCVLLCIGAPWYVWLNDVRTFVHRTQSASKWYRWQHIMWLIIHSSGVHAIHTQNGLLLKTAQTKLAWQLHSSSAATSFIITLLINHYACAGIINMHGIAQGIK